MPASRRMSSTANAHDKRADANDMCWGGLERRSRVRPCPCAAACGETAAISVSCRHANERYTTSKHCPIINTVGDVKVILFALSVHPGKYYDIHDLHVPEPYSTQDTGQACITSTVFVSRLTLIDVFTPESV
jgi:hypothetical protein